MYNIILYLTVIVNVCGYLSQNIHHTRCENVSTIEDFFNVIFAEFQNMPSCVCVQMCTDTPTYCYPNGCFRSSVMKRDVDPARIDKAQGMFLVERNFFDNMLDERKITAVSEPRNEFKMRPNQFTDLVFKRKRPKLSIRYNLREQVKNAKRKIKRDIINSKTKWPRSRISQQKLDNLARQEQNFKKYSSKRENVNVTYPNKTDNFSLEAIIDTITDSLDDTNVKQNLYITNVNMATPAGHTLKTDQQNEIPFEVISSNNTIDQKESVIEMIEKMSTEIDIQNNMNIDIVEKVTGAKFDSLANVREVPLLNYTEGRVTNDEFLYKASEGNFNKVVNSKKKNKQPIRNKKKQKVA